MKNSEVKLQNEDCRLSDKVVPMLTEKEKNFLDMLASIWAGHIVNEKKIF